MLCCSFTAQILSHNTTKGMRQWKLNWKHKNVIQIPTMILYKRNYAVSYFDRKLKLFFKKTIVSWGNFLFFVLFKGLQRANIFAVCHDLFYFNWSKKKNEGRLLFAITPVYSPLPLHINCANTVYETSVNFTVIHVRRVEITQLLAPVERFLHSNHESIISGYDCLALAFACADVRKYIRKGSVKAGMLMVGRDINLTNRKMWKGGIFMSLAQLCRPDPTHFSNLLSREFCWKLN